MKAWVTRKKLANKGETWVCNWWEPGRVRRAKHFPTRKAAEAHAKLIEAQVLAAAYQGIRSVTWAAFVDEYDSAILSHHAASGRVPAMAALRHFGRLGRPGRVDQITAATVDRYASARKLEPGAKPGSQVAATTINRELRTLKAALRVAVTWKYLAECPPIRFLREFRAPPRYVTPEHFAAIYGACEEARRPIAAGASPGTWWRAFLVTAYLTGWRLRELLELRRADVDLETGRATLQAENTKGGRSESLALHPLVVEHLRELRGFSERVFHLDRDRRLLWDEFDRIQLAAGIRLDCPRDHQHTPACHSYGFHDLRRAFATLNQARLSPQELQRLMRHQDFQTTQRYLAMARDITQAAAAIFVPDLPERRRG